MSVEIYFFEPCINSSVLIQNSKPSHTDKETVPLNKNVSQRVGCNGITLQLHDYDVIMTIPDGAIVEGGQQEIKLEILRDSSELNMEADESMACYGINCHPHGTRFHRPVHIKLPHSAVVYNPDKVNPEIASYVRNADGRKIIPLIMAHYSRKTCCYLSLET